MPRSLTCADCGKAMAAGRGSLPQGQARCHPCRRAKPAQRQNQPRDYSSRRVGTCAVCQGPKWSDGPLPCRKCQGAEPCWIDCEVCGLRFKRKMKGQRTCGRTCGAWISRQLVSPVDWLTCSICSRWHTKQSGRGYDTCSDECRVQAHAILFPPREVVRRSWQGREIECPVCATVFLVENQYTSIKVHCSTRCSRKASKLRRRVREAASYGEWRWSDFMRVARKFHCCCAYCGEKPARLDPDHVVPLSRGGLNILGNLLPACATCNGDKHTATLSEWAERRRTKGKPPRHTSWAPEDGRYWHLTVDPESVAA